jgi:hypothetical protein
LSVSNFPQIPQRVQLLPNQQPTDRQMALYGITELSLTSIDLHPTPA